MRFGVTRAPGLTAPDGRWLNSEPLDLADLRGKAVLLDFWTASCINCRHTLPILARLETVFGERLQVIGVHSPKFPAERAPATVAEAIARLGVRHPVLNDPTLHLWRQYAVKAWPTLVLIAPDGRLVHAAAGEPDEAALAARIAEALGEAPPRLAPAFTLSPPPRAGRFRYPQRIRRLPLPIGRARFALADTGHHQIALLDEEGGDVARIGSGIAGPGDGPWGGARFDSPEGICADMAALWVADTGNHLIRRVDLASFTVTTVAGFGRRGRALSQPLPGPAAALASPADVATDGRRLFIANAGTHQILAYDFAYGMVEALAGSGAEGLHDGIGRDAVLAQPTGLDFAAGRLAFCDAESSAIRLLDPATGAVTTLAGQGLFDFGAADGGLASALFQHPEALAFDGADALLVADTLNGVIRRLDLGAGTVSTLETTCLDPLCLPAGAPRGLCPDGRGGFIVVESDNHRLLRLDPAAGTTTTFAA